MKTYAAAHRTTLKAVLVTFPVSPLFLRLTIRKMISAGTTISSAATAIHIMTSPTEKPASPESRMNGVDITGYIFCT